ALRPAKPRVFVQTREISVSVGLRGGPDRTYLCERNQRLRRKVGCRSSYAIVILYCLSVPPSRPYVGGLDHKIGRRGDCEVTGEEPSASEATEVVSGDDEHGVGGVRRVWAS